MLGLHFLYSQKDRTWKKEQTGKEAIINLEGLCKWPLKCTILKDPKLNPNKNFTHRSQFSFSNITAVFYTIFQLHIDHVKYYIDHKFEQYYW